MWILQCSWTVRDLKCRTKRYISLLLTFLVKKEDKLNVYGNCLELERYRCPFLLSQRPHLTLGNLLTTCPSAWLPLLGHRSTSLTFLHKYIHFLSTWTHCSEAYKTGLKQQDNFHSHFLSLLLSLSSFFLLASFTPSVSAPRRILSQS